MTDVTRIALEVEEPTGPVETGFTGVTRTATEGGQ